MVTPFRAASTQVNGLFQPDRMSAGAISDYASIISSTARIATRKKSLID
jgi:hypothetical protein